LSKAVHLELVVDLSSDSFLSVFKKFAGRRYLPEQMYSDNATNFMGAKFRSRSDGTRLNEESSGRVVCWENIKLQCCGACGFCIDVRTTVGRSHSSRLLTALKRKSIARLELCAAHILAKLWSYVAPLLNNFELESMIP